MSHVVVVVLGDLGRSPRMQYHALSLSEMDDVKKITLFGLSGESCIAKIRESTKIFEYR